MNFALIPFFLAANVTVDRTDPWIHGPEFVFQADVTYVLSTDGPQQEEPLFATNLTTIMKCWPEALDGLVCRFQNDTMGIEAPFLIKFDERGVQSLSLLEEVSMGTLNAIRNIAKELSVGVDLRRNLMPVFVKKEDHVLGECATLFTVLKFDKNEGLFGDQERKSNYKLEVLSLPEDEADSIVVIEKRTDHKRCTNTENLFFQPQDVKIKIVNFVSKQYIKIDAFRSQSEMQIKATNINSKIFFARYTTSLELLAIEPSKQELPPMSFNVVTDLNFATLLEHNFL